MSQFMLFMYATEADTERWTQMSPEEMQQAIQEYADWSGRLAAQGKLLGGEKLRDDAGRVLRGTGAQQRVTDGPFVETREVIGGYFLIEAADYEEAVKLASDCPQLEWGGTVEIREIEAIPAA